MAKLGWRILTHPNKLWVRILTDKYLKKSNFIDVFASPHHSPLWKDILKGRDILKQGIKIGIGDGRDSSLWYHHWVGDQPIYLSIDWDIPDYLGHWRVSHIIRSNHWHL